MLRALACGISLIGLVACTSTAQPDVVLSEPLPSLTIPDAEARIAGETVAEVQRVAGVNAGSPVWAEKLYDRGGKFSGWTVIEATRPSRETGVCIVPVYFLDANRPTAPSLREDRYFAPDETVSTCAGLDPIRRSFAASSTDEAAEVASRLRETLIILRDRREQLRRFSCDETVCLDAARVLAQLDTTLIRGVVRRQQAEQEQLSFSLYEPETDALNPYPTTWGALRLDIDVGPQGRVRLYRDPPPGH